MFYSVVSQINYTILLYFCQQKHRKKVLILLNETHQQLLMGSKSFNFARLIYPSKARNEVASPEGTLGLRNTDKSVGHGVLRKFLKNKLRVIVL